MNDPDGTENTVPKAETTLALGRRRGIPRGWPAGRLTPMAAQHPRGQPAGRASIGPGLRPRARAIQDHPLLLGCPDPPERRRARGPRRQGRRHQPGGLPVVRPLGHDHPSRTPRRAVARRLRLQRRASCGWLRRPVRRARGHFLGPRPPARPDDPRRPRVPPSPCAQPGRAALGGRDRLARPAPTCASGRRVECRPETRGGLDLEDSRRRRSLARPTGPGSGSQRVHAGPSRPDAIHSSSRRGSTAISRRDVSRAAGGPGAESVPMAFASPVRR